MRCALILGACVFQFLLGEVLAAVSCRWSAAPAVLDSWRAAWSPYRLVDDRGVELRLAKASIEFSEPTSQGLSLFLRDSRNRVLDAESIPAGKKGAWAHGFWLPLAAINLVLELRSSETVVATRAVAIAGSSDNPASLPLRLDRLDRRLLDRLESRESAAAPSQSAGVVSYLTQHDVVYLQPSPEWDEGLPIGNGDLGGLVSGRQGSEQTFFLDKTDIWLATAEDKALGRSFACTLRIRYSSGSKVTPFLQRLSLGRAEVTTVDGAFSSTVRVHALRNRLDVDIHATEFEIVLARASVPLWDNAAASLDGAWAAISTPERLAEIRAAVALAPHTHVEFGHAGKQAWLIHTAPNLRYAVVASVTGAAVDWKGGVGRVRANGPVRVSVAIATSRETADPLACARRLAQAAPDRATHLEWWRRFWQRSWIELPDKLEENLWYIGIYQQAACSRSDQAVGFFGLFQPLNFRGWLDAYVADAQVEMMWWETFATNHLVLLYPSHRTFGRLAVEAVEHTPGPGMVVPHLFVPEWAGGHRWFTGTNPYKGSVAWYTMNFWWDYLYSGDREFLRNVTYPLLQMVADYFASFLVKEPDGRYHCYKSGSPEQSNTANDNVYDWGLITYLFRAAGRASEILGVDSEARLRWREMLDHLFLPPGDSETLWETPTSPHPYRCHPVVLFGLYPTGAIAWGSSDFERARRTLPVVTRLVGYRYEDRHETIPGFEGGVEPNGFSSGILTIAAARLGDREQYRRFLYGLIVRFHMKQNGLRAMLDTRHTDDIARASLVEAANAHTVATTETLLQSWDDHIRLFPCIAPKGRYRFSGLRAVGGFIVSAESIDGRLEWAQVKSLQDASLRIRWKDGGREFQCRAGATYEIRPDPNVPIDLDLPPTEQRHAPRSIPITTVENQGERLLHYPEDIPFGQVVHDENLYLGRPAAYGSHAPAPSTEALLSQTASQAWEDRQDAARRLARTKPVPEVLAALDRLCADPVSVVAHTAVVTLVHFGTAEAINIARNHAASNRVAGLRREVEKAVHRRTERGRFVSNQ